MKAQDRAVKDWMTQIKLKRLGLPRWQRFESWGPTIITDFLTSIVRGLPVGVALILEVGNKPQFQYRHLRGVPESGESLKELLLDGQQRLTALWRTLTDNYEDKTYLLDLDIGEDQDISAIAVSRWVKKTNERRYPLWVDDPKSCWEREKTPFRILNPDNDTEYIQWCGEATDGDKDKQIELITKVNELRNSISQFNIPYLELPAETRPEVAIDVFIQLNTSYVRLTAFDIIVAQVEEATAQSLHQKVRELESKVPEIKDYINSSNYVLSVAALLQDKLPNQRGFFSLDLEKMIADWDKITTGTVELVEFMEEQKIYDGERLPTETILAPLAVLLLQGVENPDKKGNLRMWLNKYLWRSFFTERYERSIPTRILQDFRAIREAVSGEGTWSKVPIFDDTSFPLPTEELLREAGWPKKKDRLARALLLLSLRGGAKDFADSSEISRKNIKTREYHHIYPASFLQKQGLDENDANRALNCALITWKTNRVISAKEPLEYLLERADANALGKEEVCARLSTHLIDYDMLVRGDYEEFINVRSKVMREVLGRLCEFDSRT